jgi:hypothetical protein
LRGRWQRLWHTEAPVLSLALFRALFAYCLWREVWTTWSKSVYAIASDGYHLPYLDFLPLVSRETYDLIHTVQLPLVVLVGIGLLMRPALAVLLCLQGYVLFADQLNFRNHPYFFVLLILLLLPSDAHRALSVRALIDWRRTRREPLGQALLGAERPLTFQRLMQFTVCVAYVYAGLHKLNPAFLAGDVMAGHLAETLEEWSGQLVQLLGMDRAVRVRDLLLSRNGLIAAAVTSAALELLLPIALCLRRTRPVAIVIGLGFHASIAFLMDINTFSMAMAASYLLFLDPRTLPNLARAAGLLSPRATGPAAEHPI